MGSSRLLAEVRKGRRTLTFNRPDRRNSFDADLLADLGRALDEAAADATCRMVVLEGRGGFFSTGLDFGAALESGAPDGSRPYVEVLRRIASLPAVVVANVDGEVRAGGLGFVAASDVALATPTSTFGLPEAIWGLVPACVGLWVARRVGPHATKRMSLTTEVVTADKALSMGLLDEVSADPRDALRRLELRVSRLRRETLERIKRFFGDLAGFEKTREERAVQETDRGMSDPDLRAGIASFVREGRFPWQDRR